MISFFSFALSTMKFIVFWVFLGASSSAASPWMSFLFSPYFSRLSFLLESFINSLDRFIYQFICVVYYFIFLLHLCRGKKKKKYPANLLNLLSFLLCLLFSIPFVIVFIYVQHSVIVINLLFYFFCYRGQYLEMKNADDFNYSSPFPVKREYLFYPTGCMEYYLSC